MDWGLSRIVGLGALDSLSMGGGLHLTHTLIQANAYSTTLHTAHCTLHTCTLHTALCTLHTAFQALLRTLHYKHAYWSMPMHITPHIAYRTLHLHIPHRTAQYTIHTPTGPVVQATALHNVTLQTCTLHAM